MQGIEIPSREALEPFFGRDDPISRIVPLAGDASTRKYYRVLLNSGSHRVVMVMPNPGTGEESSFLEMQGFLDRLGLPVPRVYGHRHDLGLVLLEDLGDDLLETVVDRSSEEATRALYRDAVDILSDMRRRATGPADGCPAFGLAFDEAKLMFEMDYFMEHFVRGLCGKVLSAHAQSTLNSFFLEICRFLADQPRVLTHRDYHARNLIFHNDRLVMIDFQDARMGPAQYDLASLLRDSYVTLPVGLVDELIRRYWEAEPSPNHTSPDRFTHVFDIMSLQRNMKALGTFGYQLSVRRNDRFRSAIPRTGGYIECAMERHPEFKDVRSVVLEYVCEPCREFA
ncbi:MAG: phosphotransferase [Pseudomonadota bacterium]